MNLFLCAYNCILFYIIFFILPFYWIFQKLCYKNDSILMHKLGMYPNSVLNKIKDCSIVWIHASSVGEVKVASRIINILESKFKNIDIVLSTTTFTGNNYAKTILNGNITVIFAPLDLFFCIRFALSKIKPKIMVYIETEIWPNWINEAKYLGITTIFLNGRISKNSFRKYKNIKCMLKSILNKVDLFSMVSDTDKLRIVSIGAPENRVVVNGNIKFDIIESEYNYNIINRMHKLYSISNNVPVLVAGSIRSSEEVSIVDAYIKVKCKFNNVILLIAPRHINRVPKIEKLAKNKGLETIRRSSLNTNPYYVKSSTSLIILDTLGELADTYSVATIAFCGASLVKLGGQNIIEPAAWGKPIIHGPFMDDFKEAITLLKKYGASITVHNSNELAAAIIFLLENSKYAKYMGNLAKNAILTNKGVSKKHVDILEELIGKFI